MTTLLAYTAELARTRDAVALAAWQDGWAERLRALEDRARAAAVALGSDPEGAIAPADESRDGTHRSRASVSHSAQSAKQSTIRHSVGWPDAARPERVRSMSVDVVVAVPAFMDMTFVGLEGLPGLGEERFAGDLVRSPGGGAITAIGCARLGLATALAAPLGHDAAGDLIGPMLEDEGVQLVGPRSSRTPVTAVMPIGDERAMVTYDPGVRARATDVAAHSPRAVITGLSQLDVVPPNTRAYVTVGDDDARAFAGRLPGAASRATGLFIEQREALVLTGAGTPQEAAEMIGARVKIVVVSLGADGAAACVDGRAVAVDGFDVGPSIDTTGAGDLFVAAWAWGDAAGLSVDDALRWAALYAALSVRVPTGAGGATRLAEFVEEGTRRGLPTPPPRGERVA